MLLFCSAQAQDKEPSEAAEGGLEAQDKSPQVEKDRVFLPFKIGGGYILGWGAKAGLSLLYIEPKYAITDHIDVGVRYEKFVFRDYRDVYSLRSDYTFTTKVVRPSVGLGLGRYALGDFSFGGGDAVDLHTVFGIAPRVQLNIGIIVLGLTYHYTFDDRGGSFVGNLGLEFDGRRTDEGGLEVQDKSPQVERDSVFRHFKIGGGVCFRRGC